jgi:hypothetical protein
MALESLVERRTFFYKLHYKSLFLLLGMSTADGNVTTKIYIKNRVFKSGGTIKYLDQKL